MSSKKNYWALILAAGTSSRLGRPKQLVTFRDKYLVNHIADICLSAGLDSVCCVLGHRADEIGRTLKSDVRQIFNPDYKEGMGTSLACGIQEIEKSDAGAVVVLLVDQYLLEANILKTLIDCHRTGDEIVACRYDNLSYGPPALFDRKDFHELSQLSGDTGAKGILEHYRGKARFIHFPKGKNDIDHPEDLGKLI